MKLTATRPNNARGSTELAQFIGRLVDRNGGILTLAEVAAAAFHAGYNVAGRKCLYSDHHPVLCYTTSEFCEAVVGAINGFGLSLEPCPRRAWEVAGFRPHPSCFPTVLKKAVAR